MPIETLGNDDMLGVQKSDYKYSGTENFVYLYILCESFVGKITLFNIWGLQAYKNKASIVLFVQMLNKLVSLWVEFEVK